MDAFSAAEVSNWGIPSEAFQNDTDLLFGGELTPGDALDILDELFGLFAPGFSLPEFACNLLYYGLLLL